MMRKEKENNTTLLTDLSSLADMFLGLANQFPEVRHEAIWAKDHPPIGDDAAEDSWLDGFEDQLPHLGREYKSVVLLRDQFGLQGLSGKRLTCDDPTVIAIRSPYFVEDGAVVRQFYCCGPFSTFNSVEYDGAVFEPLPLLGIRKFAHLAAIASSLLGYLNDRDLYLNPMFGTEESQSGRMLGIRLAGKLGDPRMGMFVNPVDVWLFAVQQHYRWPVFYVWDEDYNMRASLSCVSDLFGSSYRFCRHVIDAVDNMQVIKPRLSLAYHDPEADFEMCKISQLSQDPKMLERNEWLYEKCSDTSVVYKKVIADLKRMCPERDWDPITSIPGITKAANQWAVSNGKTRLRKRKD